MKTDMDASTGNNGFIVSEGLGAVLMDVQPRILTSIQGNEELHQSFEIYARSMSILKIPLVLTEQVPSKLGVTPGSISKYCDQTFSKNSFSAFGDPYFCNWIESNKISHLLLGGIETPICIYLTAMEARRRNIGVTVLTDCVSGRRKEDEEYAMIELSNSGTHLLGLETVLYSFLNSSEHPAFREISHMVRNR